MFCVGSCSLFQEFLIAASGFMQLPSFFFVISVLIAFTTHVYLFNTWLSFFSILFLFKVIFRFFLVQIVYFSVSVEDTCNNSVYTRDHGGGTT